MLQPIRINLARAPQRGKRLGRGALLAGAVAAAVLTAANLYLAWQQQSEIRDYSARIAALGKQTPPPKTQGSAAAKASAEALAQAQRELALVQRLAAEDRFPWNAVLEELEQRLPDDMALQELSPAEKGQRLTIKGRTADPQQVAVLLQNLSTSAFLRKPELVRIAIDPSAAQTGAAKGGLLAVSFEARCALALDRLTAKPATAQPQTQEPNA